MSSDTQAKLNIMLAWQKLDMPQLWMSVCPDIRASSQGALQIPSYLMHKESLVLEFSKGASKDVQIGGDGILATMRFKGDESRVRIPWALVSGMQTDESLVRWVVKATPAIDWASWDFQTGTHPLIKGPRLRLIQGGKR